MSIPWQSIGYMWDLKTLLEHLPFQDTNTCIFIHSWDVCIFFHVFNDITSHVLWMITWEMIADSSVGLLVTRYKSNLLEKGIGFQGNAKRQLSTFSNWSLESWLCLSSSCLRTCYWRHWPTFLSTKLYVNMQLPTQPMGENMKTTSQDLKFFWEQAGLWWRLLAIP